MKIRAHDLRFPTSFMKLSVLSYPDAVPRAEVPGSQASPLKHSSRPSVTWDGIHGPYVRLVPYVVICSERRK